MTLFKLYSYCNERNIYPVSKEHSSARISMVRGKHMSTNEGLSLYINLRSWRQIIGIPQTEANKHLVLSAWRQSINRVCPVKSIEMEFFAYFTNFQQIAFAIQMHVHWCVPGDLEGGGTYCLSF
uniref:Tenascin-N n=1 Tax=Schistocephalus solidus TaxID=70667 RepID=A0A0X3PTX1_SCHSO